MTFFEELIQDLKTSCINSKALVIAKLENLSLEDAYQIRDEMTNLITEKRLNGEGINNSEALNIIKSYTDMHLQINLLQEQIDQLSIFVKGPTYDGVHKQPDVHSVEKQHIKLHEAKEKLQSMLSKSSNKLLQCLEIINSIPDERVRFVLTNVYLNHKTLYQTLIDAPFDASYRTLLRLKAQGLRYLSEMEVPNASSKS